MVGSTPNCLNSFRRRNSSSSVVGLRSRRHRILVLEHGHVRTARGSTPLCYSSHTHCLVSMATCSSHPSPCSAQRCVAPAPVGNLGWGRGRWIPMQPVWHSTAPADGKCLLLIAHRWTGRTDYSVHACSSLPPSQKSLCCLDVKHLPDQIMENLVYAPLSAAQNTLHLHVL